MSPRRSTLGALEAKVHDVPNKRYEATETGVFSPTMLSQLTLPKSKQKSTMALQRLKNPVNRRTLVTAGAKRSHNQFQRETFCANNAGRVTMLPLEETGKKKETMRTSLDVGEYQQRATRGPILLGKRRSSQALSNPNDS